MIHQPKPPRNHDPPIKTTKKSWSTNQNHQETIINQPKPTRNYDPATKKNQRSANPNHQEINNQWKINDQPSSQASQTQSADLSTTSSGRRLTWELPGSTRGRRTMGVAMMTSVRHTARASCSQPIYASSEDRHLLAETSRLHTHTHTHTHTHARTHARTHTQCRMGGKDKL